MQSALKSLEGVNEARVSLQSGDVVVIYENGKVSVEKMKKKLEPIGYGVDGHSRPKQYGGKEAIEKE